MQSKSCSNLPPPRLKTLVRIVVWQIKSRLQHEVIVSWIANQKLAVRRGMTGATGNVYVGLHEFPDMMFLLHFLIPRYGIHRTMAGGLGRAGLAGQK
jgi:hypothetical protein